jgi:hypothetical protein
LVAGGLLDGGELAIASTKYLDFTGQTTLAVRAAMAGAVIDHA